MITAPVFMPVGSATANPSGLYVLGGALGSLNAPNFPARCGFATAVVLSAPSPAHGQSRTYVVKVIVNDADGRQVGAGQVEANIEVRSNDEGELTPFITMPILLPEIAFDVAGPFDGSLVLLVDNERVSSFPVSIRKVSQQS